MKPWKLALFLVACTLSLSSIAHAAPDWTAPTPEELSMKSEPKAPGAVAIYLDREETDSGLKYLNTVLIHRRIKILKEAGKDAYGNLKIQYASDWEGIYDFQGRTIHSDGTVIPFQGNGLDQVEVNANGEHVREKVYAMPDVQVGSILEFQFTVSYVNDLIMAPTWYLQSNLFTRRIHNEFIPFRMSATRFLLDPYGNVMAMLAYTSVLPDGVRPQKLTHATIGNEGGDVAGVWTLDMQDVPPLPHAAHLPPIDGLSYRVQFFYSSSGSPQEFWKDEGKYWSKSVNKFAKPGSQVQAAVASWKQGSQEQTLRAIYAAVMQVQNTRYLHDGSVSAAEQQSPSKSSDDVWTRKRGTPQQITRLFVAMSRAAGMQAYVMDVANRDKDIFSASDLSMQQLNGEVAIVKVNGQEQYFDPGALYCPYGQLEWVHTLAGGLRQTDSGTALAQTPGISYKDTSTQRTASLWLATNGTVNGTVQLVFRGQQAIHIRDQVADKDDAGATKDYEELLRSMVPKGMTVHLTNVANAKDGEQPLILEYRISGPVATVLSNRLLVPSQLFRAQAKQVFVSPVRKVGVYFHYPYTMVDQVELKLPTSVKVESLPKDVDATDPQVAVYQTKTVQTGNTVTFQRMMVLASIYIDTKDYAQLRNFYSQVNTGDTSSAIFQVVPTAAAQ